MPGTHFRRTRFLVEPEITFSVDPDAAGTNYLPVRILGDIGLLVDGRIVLPTNYFVGRNANTPSEVGNNLATLQFDVPFLGYPSAGGAGASPGGSSSDDWLDTILDAAFGAHVDGLGLSIASATNTTVTTNAQTFVQQDLLPVQDPNANGGIFMWRRCSTVASNVYTGHRAWDANPTATGFVRPARHWGPLLDPGGASLSAVYDLDGSQYTVTGGRPNMLKLNLTSGQLAKLTVGMRFDNLNFTSKASLPTFSTWTGTPIKGQLSYFEWGGTVYPAKSIEIDFGLGGSDSDSVLGANGRANIENLRADPIITITPLYLAQNETDFLNGTQRTFGVRLGSGSSGSNSCCFWAENAQITASPIQNDQLRLRQALKIEVRDGGIFSGTTAARLWQLSRA